MQCMNNLGWDEILRFTALLLLHLSTYGYTAVVPRDFPWSSRLAVNRNGSSQLM
jgi:hypothetical protein